jgi:hypothetical protein
MTARHLLAWLVALPLTAAGTFLTHNLVPARPEHSHSEAGQTLGLGFFCSLPFLLSCVALLALVIVVRIVQTCRQRAGVGVSAWPFATLVPLGFFLHHHLQHLVSGGPGALPPLTEPTLLMGLVLQLPFALLAYLIVTALLRAADKLGAALAARRLRYAPRIVRTPARKAVWTPRVALFATAGAPRGPPLAA